jgi:hypothetical protein
VSEAAGEIFDDVGRHLAEARSFDRAALPLGIYLAWCAGHGLLSADLNERAADLVLRVRFRDVSGAELAVAGCGGVLAGEHLNDEGQAFTARHYRDYLQAFRDLLGPDPYATQDEWAQYDRLAPWLTRRLMASRGHGAPAASRASSTSGGLGLARAWLKFWR